MQQRLLNYVFFLSLLTTLPIFGQTPTDENLRTTEAIATFVVEPFLQDAEPTSMRIKWETTTATTALVEWGITANNLNQSSPASSETTENSNELHEVFLNNLSPKTRYFYRTVTDGTVSDIYEFITPPLAAANEPTRLVAMSDMQKDGGNPLKFQEVVQDGVLSYLAAEYGADLPANLNMVLIPGDLVVTGSNYSQWSNDFFGQGQDLLHEVPLYPVPGNHEQNSNYFFQYFSLPQNGTPGFEEHWWYKDYSNIRIIGLDSNSGYRIQEQLDWLDATLATACSDVHLDFVFVQLHHPFLSELWTPGELNFTGEVISRLENFSTDCNKPSIHFFGHTHGYSRGQSRDHSHLWVNVATAGGNIDYWGEFAQQDYDEFTVSHDDYGFVVLNVQAGDEPEFTLTRVTRGNENVFKDNEIQDVITVRKNDAAPATPTGLYPNTSDINPSCVVFQANAFSDIGDEHQGTHWQLATDVDFTNIVDDRWKQKQNWYFGENTQAADDLTNETFQNLASNANYFWRVRYRDSHLKWSDWSEAVSFQTNTSDLTVNLLTNSGAEEGIDDWSVTTGILESLTALECNGISPYAGSRYFGIGGLCTESAYAEAEQLVDVTTHATDIDNGSVSALFSAYFSNFSGTDRPSLYIEALDAAQNLLSTSTTLTSLNDNWTFLSENLSLPVNTRFVKVVMTGTRNGGTDNDSYLDDISLRLNLDGDLGCDELVLPVQLLNFQAACHQEVVHLKWTSQAEYQLAFYEIERRSQFGDWESIGQQIPQTTANNSKNYQWADNNLPKSSQLYYRLKLVEKSGKTAYSSLVETTCQTAPSFKLYPNPTTGQFFVETKHTNNVVLNLSLSDALGRVVWRQQQSLQDWKNAEGAFDLEGLRNGVYFLKIDDGRQVVVKRVVKR